MRIFIGVDLDSEIRARIERFVEGVRGFAPDARWARPESLHITLKFIGEQTAAQVEAIVQTIEAWLRRVEAGAFEIRCAGYGFFPSVKAPRVFWIGIQAGPELGELAARIDEAVAELGVAREDCPYSPHLTLARAGGGSGAPKWRAGDGANKTFAVLEKRLGAMGELDFGTMSVREFILYRSQLSPAGSKYTRLERFPLRLNS